MVQENAKKGLRGTFYLTFTIKPYRYPSHDPSRKYIEIEIKDTLFTPKYTVLYPQY